MVILQDKNKARLPMTRYKINDAELIKVANKYKEKGAASAAKELKIPYSTFIRHAKRLGVHYPNQGGKGWKVPHNKTTKEIFINEILVEKSKWEGKGQKVKENLVKFGLKNNVCEICGQIPEWNNKPLVLQLDHINGNKTDNRIENLRIVCPNCHTQTETFSCKNI